MNSARWNIKLSDFKIIKLFASGCESKKIIVLSIWATNRNLLIPLTKTNSASGQIIF